MASSPGSEADNGSYYDDNPETTTNSMIKNWRKDQKKQIAEKDLCSLIIREKKMMGEMMIFV